MRERWAEGSREEWEDQESEAGRRIVILKVLCGKCNGINEKWVESTKSKPWDRSQSHSLKTGNRNVLRSPCQRV